MDNTGSITGTLFLKFQRFSNFHVFLYRKRVFFLKPDLLKSELKFRIFQEKFLMIRNTATVTHTACTDNTQDTQNTLAFRLSQTRIHVYHNLWYLLSGWRTTLVAVGWVNLALACCCRSRHGRTSQTARPDLPPFLSLQRNRHWKRPQTRTLDK